MTRNETFLLIPFVCLCIIPGIISGFLSFKKKRHAELFMALLILLAMGAPLVFFFVWSLFDRPVSRGFWEISNFSSALGMALVYGGPAAAVIGISSVPSYFISRTVLKRNCVH